MREPWGIYNLVGVVPARPTSQLDPVHASLRSPASHQACGNGAGLARAAQRADLVAERRVAYFAENQRQAKALQSESVGGK
jgi:hypothetical protein